MSAGPARLAATIAVGVGLGCAGLACGSVRAEPSPATTELPPPQLRQALSPETLQRAFDEADSAYRARHFAQAEQALVQLTELAPDFARAWLRLGNLHHQQRRLARAEYAYRRAAAVPEYGVADPDTRHRALANLVILGLDQAQAAMRDLERSAGSDALQTMLGDAPTRLAQLEVRRAPPAAGSGSAATTPERIVGPLPRESRGVTLARHRRDAGVGRDPDAVVQSVGSDARPFGSGRGRVHGAQP